LDRDAKRELPLTNWAFIFVCFLHQLGYHGGVDALYRLVGEGVSTI